MKDTKTFGILYKSEHNSNLIGYTNKDQASRIDDRKSTSLYVFLLGSNIISWALKKQKTITLSSIEVEYMVGTSITVETIQFRRILQDLQQSIKAPIKIYYDNMSIIAMTKNPIFHSCTKHIEIRYHFI